tara:strand:+ start:137 stop:319 length:183 start_codon:yes stop_codon:yes gene_type:complete
MISHQLPQGARIHLSDKESRKILKVSMNTKAGMTKKYQGLGNHYLKNNGKAQQHEEEDSM